MPNVLQHRVPGAQQLPLQHCPLGQQLPSQHVCPLGQHTPLQQVCPLGQHAPLQLVCPLGQHVPLLHVCPLGQQVLPQTWLVGQHVGLVVLGFRQVNPLGGQQTPALPPHSRLVQQLSPEFIIVQMLKLTAGSQQWVPQQRCALGQQVPPQQRCPLGQQVLPQIWPVGQHPARIQVCPVGHGPPQGSTPVPHPLPLVVQISPLAQQMLEPVLKLKQQLRPAGQQPAAPQTAPVQHWPSRQVPPSQVPQLTT